MTSEGLDVVISIEYSGVYSWDATKTTAKKEENETGHRYRRWYRYHRWCRYHQNFHHSLKAVSWDAPQAASGGTVRVLGHIVEGIDQATAKKINKDIKDQKLKVKVTIEADKLRVSSASKDALQTVIQFLRDQDYGQPLQFTNYR